MVRVRYEDTIVLKVEHNAVRVCRVFGHERAVIRTEHLYAAVVGVRDEQEASVVIERQASCELEQACVTTRLLGTDRERDARISVERASVVHMLLNHANTGRAE